MANDNTPTTDELQAAGVPMREVLRGEAGDVVARDITVTLAPDEYNQIGGTEEALHDLARDTQAFVNKWIAKTGRAKKKKKVTE